MRIVVGVGCDRGTPLETLEAALDQALTLTGLGRETVCGLATIDRKHDEACILSLAAQQQWPVQFFSAEQLAQVPVPNPSATVLKHMGTPAVAEAAALLAARAGLDQLLVEKYKYRGADGRNATVSIVRTNDE